MQSSEIKDCRDMPTVDSRCGSSRAAHFAVTVMLTASFAFTASARAQEWPTHPVTVVFPYGSGGGDVITRLVVDKVGNRLGQKFVVENRPGAAGIIGTNSVARVAPDGYTLIVSGLGSMILAPFFNKASFDPVKSFTHIAFFGGGPAALVVSASSEARNLQEFVALSKKQADGLTYGTPGRGTTVHLVSEMFRTQSGAKLTHVPYKDAARVLADLAGGQISAGFLSSAAVLPLVKAGQIRLLATAGERRSEEFPDVPTFAEAGYKDLVATAWFGLSGPAGIPRTIVHKLNVEVRAALVHPDVRALLRKLDVETKDLDADAFTRFVTTERDRWAAVTRSLESTQEGSRDGRR